MMTSFKGSAAMPSPSSSTTSTALSDGAAFPSLPPPLAEKKPSTPLSLPPALSNYLPPWVPQFFSENPYFTAGFGLIGVGAALSILRTLAFSSTVAARRMLLTSLEIPSKDFSYSWVMQWLIARGSSTRHLGVETTYLKESSGHVKVAFDYIPSTGRHILNYKNRFILVKREREKQMVDMTTGSPWETLTLTTFVWDKRIFNQLLHEARDMALQKDEGKTIIYTSFGQEWRPFGNPKRARQFSSVILSDGIAERVLEDVLDFLKGSLWYFERGIPYRRGYLLYGPPGCGKSSFVMALAGHLKYNICILNVEDPLLTDDRLQYLLATVPPRTFLLLEDIDGAVAPENIPKSYKVGESASSVEEGGGSAASGATTVIVENRTPSSRRVTFSGLLNALDGVAATEERVIFMTTNQIDKLPEALIRPGRVDLKIRIGYATASQIKRMFLRFFPEEEEAAEEFTEILAPMHISMAELQGFFLFCKDASPKAIEMARQWRDMEVDAHHKSSSSIASEKPSKDATKPLQPASNESEKPHK